MNNKFKNYLKKIGLIGFLFFLIKGIVWLFVFYFSGSLINKSIKKNKSEIVLHTYKVENNTTAGIPIKFKILVPDSSNTSTQIINYANFYLQGKFPSVEFVINKDNLTFIASNKANADTMPLLLQNGFYIIN